MPAEATEADRRQWAAAPVADYQFTAPAGGGTAVAMAPEEEADMQDISDTFSKDIVDDIMLYALLLVVLLKYLEVVLEILSHYKCNLKPNKTRFNEPSQEFVWVDMRNE